MKNSLICISLALLSAVSCSKDNIAEEGFRTIDATLSPVSPSGWTKAHIDFNAEPFQPVWDDGDGIAVVTERFPQGIAFTLTGGAGTPAGHFSSSSALNDTTSYFAVYPASAVSGSVFTSDGAAVTVEYPSRLSFDFDTRCSDSDNFMAASGSDRNFEFKNIHCYLELAIDGPGDDAVKSLTIKGKKGEIVAGKATVKFVGGIPEVSFVSGQDAVTVDFGEDGLEFSSDVLDIALPPVLSNGFEVTVTTVNGKTVTARSSESCAPLLQNTILSMEDPIEVK